MADLRTHLKNGQSIPSVGYGCYKVTGTDAVEVLTNAAKCGYRHFDSASFYKNEREVGEALNGFMKSTGLKRSEVFYTTKAWPAEQGAQLSSNIDRALERCGLGYIDLMLLHWPDPDKETRTSSWKILAEAVKAGKLRGAGVSNYSIAQLQEIDELDTGIEPVVNQIEISPWTQDHSLIHYCQSRNIILEAYCPLAKAQNMDDPTLIKIAKQYHKTPAQILVKWSLQRGFVPLPKSSNEGRMKTNLDVDGFEISKQDMETLNDFAK